MMCLTKAGKRKTHVRRFGLRLKTKGTEGKSRLTLIVHAAVLVLLAGHEGLDLRLRHLLSCKGIHVKITLSVSHATSGKQTIYCVSIFGQGDLRPTQGGQHNAQLSAHDCAVALLVENTQTLNVVINGALGEGVDLLQHGQESVKVEPLVGHICRATNTRLFKGFRPTGVTARLRSKVDRVMVSDPGSHSGSLTVGGRVAQNLCNILVSGVLAQSAHDVGYLVVGHLVVTDSVKETEGLLEVWSGRENTWVGMVREQR